MTWLLLRFNGHPDLDRAAFCQNLSRLRADAGGRDPTLRRRPGRPGYRPHSRQMASNQEPDSSVIHGPLILAATMHCIGREHVFMAHQNDLSLNIGRPGHEVLFGAPTQINEFGLHAPGWCCRRSHERNAGERSTHAIKPLKPGLSARPA